MSDEQLKRTALHETHKQLGAKMVPFGGYDMPVWYISVLEEHNAVRGGQNRLAAGLFDVSHMGVWDARGPNATLFLDAITTNDVLDIAVGGSQYSYLLDANGDVVDDIMLYRLEKERYLIVVNASNNDKDWDWVRSWNDGAHAIKPPTCQLRDLRNKGSGEDQRVDVALQGPASLRVLVTLVETRDRASLQALARTEVMTAKLAGLDVFISRTGYTGESVAYEIFVHPDHIVALWNAILAAGKDLGVKPCGLAARDSLRTEAGLPLYGHELAGPLNLAPYHIGFGGYAKAYKPFFVGKAAYVAKAAQAKQKLSRFKFNKKGVRPPKQGTSVLDASGNPIGTVTSCAQDSEGLLLGLVMLDTSVGAKDGTPIYFAARPGAPLDEAFVLTRFPKRK
jgi:glycine cleavage system T protein